MFLFQMVNHASMASVGQLCKNVHDYLWLFSTIAFALERPRMCRVLVSFATVIPRLCDSPRHAAFFSPAVVVSPAALA